MSAALEAEWQEMLNRMEIVRRRAQDLADLGKPVRFRTQQGKKLLVSPDLDVPGEWRVTTFDAAGQPWGHYCCRNAFEAFREVLNGHAEPLP